ncbi:uncharacterized protein FFB20_15942 [Fusarium fujikuroi]|nr:uncharacterized protein FFC1_02957 [Fusarium fujikuroi]SCO20502.1 uncharacterized protein FFB20_15942 [Fusarium fujikuroi]
MAERGY